MDAPVPPRPTASVPVHPNVSDASLSSDVAGLPPNVRVTLVSSVLVKAPAAVYEGAAVEPVALPK